MQRHWSANVSDPFELVEWVTTHIKLSNWKTGQVVYENDVEHPVDWAQSAVEMCASKYFRRADIPNIGGEHSIKQLAARVANDLAQHGKKRGYFTSEEAQIFRDEIIAGFITQRIGFNSPVWFNFGLYNEYGIEGTKGRDRFFVNPDTNEIEQLDRELIRPGGAACFLTKVTDSLFSDDGDGMYDWLATQTKIFLTGAGDGANVSNIRGVGEPISGGGISAGLPAFLPVRDQASGYIKSGGKTRRSATMLVCDLDHPDIEWFINWKRHEEAKAQALIAMGYEADYEGEAYSTVSGQNSNNSVRVSNAFMETFYTGGNWHLLSRCAYDRFEKADMKSLSFIESHPQGEIWGRNGKPEALVNAKGETKKIMKVVKASDLWSQIAESAWACGCPGIHFQDTINTWNTMPHYGEIRTSNPCFSGNTLIPTSTGLVRIADWASEGYVRRLWSNGKWIEATAFPTKISETIILRFSNGFEITCTPDHRFELADGGEVLAKDALDQKIKVTAPEVDKINEWDDNLVFQGFMQGDGSFHEAFGYFKYIYIGENDTEVKDFVESLGIVLTQVKDRPCIYSLPLLVGKGLCKTLKPVFLAFRDLTDDIFYLPPSSMASFLRGLYSANGSVIEKHSRVTLKTTCRNLASQVQQALLSLGIRSHVTTNKHTIAKFYNGIYECRESYDLNITSSDCVEFANKIGFIQSYKNEELKRIVEKGHFEPYLYPRVVEIVDGEVEQVYDFTLQADLKDEERWACVSGVSAHNCSEVFQPDNTTCNLCSINLIKFFADFSNPDWAGFEHASKLATTALDLVVDISSYPTPQHARGAWDIRSIGVNHGNIGAVLMRNAIPYDSNKGRAVMSMITNAMTLFCWQQSHELALKLGSYPAYHEENHRNILKLHQVALMGDDMVDRYREIIADFDLNRLIEEWEQISGKSAFRNSNVTCLVPQGTIGLVLGQDTTGCEPDFALKKSKKCVGGTFMDFVNTSVEPALKRLGYDEERTRLILAYVMKYGAVENCPYIQEDHLPIFDTAVRQKTCLDAIAYIARNLEEEEVELIFKATGNENDPFKLKAALIAARQDEDEWEELLEDLDTVSEINEIIKNCTSIDQVRKVLIEHDYDPHSILPCVQIFTRVIGHNGHIDALGAFQTHISMGISKCVTGDTLIQTDKGFIEIGSLHDGIQKEDSFTPLEMKVMTKDGKANTDSFYYGGKKRILRVELSNGQVISATPNHPLFASIECGEQDPSWQNTENIRPGDYVAIDVGRDEWSNDFISTKSFIPTPRYNAQKVCVIPDIVDAEIGWLLGVFASVGHHVRSNWTIGFTSNNECVLQKLAVIFWERFGINVKIERDYRNDVGYVKVASKTLYEFFSWCGALGTYADKQIPWVILQSPREVVVWFISGLWLDGFVPKAVASACIALKSKKMVDHLQILLHNLGIRCTQQVKNSDQYGPIFHLMTVSRESFEKFADTIPLDDDWKVAQIRQHLAQKIDVAHDFSDFVPNSIRREAAVAYSSIHELDSKTKTFGTLVCEATVRCSWQVADEALKAAGREGLGTMHWVQVSSIIEDEEEVYDVSVPGHRSFIGNGIVCHNTVNMNHDVSIGDIAKAYERAYEKGCKCIAVYRDDSKKSQPLNTGTNKGGKVGKKISEKSVETVSFEESIDAYLKTPEGLQDALNRVVRNPELAALVPPTRREASFHTSVGDRFRFTLSHQGSSIGVFIRFNCWEGTNDLMEVFIDLGKEGDTISGLVDSMARMISLGLQFGIPPQVIGDMLEGMSFGPSGFLGKSSVFGIRSVKSVPDLVGKLLKILPEYYAMGRPEAMLHPKPYSPEDPPRNTEVLRQADIIVKTNGCSVPKSRSNHDVKTIAMSNLISSSASFNLSPVETSSLGSTNLTTLPGAEITNPQEARLRGFTGSTCKKCGSLRTSGTGSCFQCLDCGEYSGPCAG